MSRTAQPSLLLYRFSEGELAQLRALLGPASAVRIIPVQPAGYGMTLEALLAGETPPLLSYGAAMDRKMLVLADVQGDLFHFLLAACAQVTGTQPVLRAMVTETNRSWTGAALCEHLMEEEAELAAMQRGGTP